MELIEQAWYVRWFRMSELVWNRFRDKDHLSPRSTTNLCTLIRTMIVWLPLTVIANVATWLAVIWLVIVQPARTYGLLNYLASLGGILCIAAAIAFIGGVIWLTEQVKEYHEKGSAARHMKKRVAQERRAEKGPDFLEIAWAWLKSRHDKICVLINLKESPNV